MGLPAPRRVRGKPYVQISSASAWTTLQLVVYADGRSKGSLIGASPFPRHWVYDHEGQLIEKSGTIDFEKWYRESYGENTPWGGEDTPAFVTAVETELERDLSRSVMDPRKLPRRRLEVGDTLVEQGAEEDDLFLLLDGVLDVEVDGAVVAQVGPGAIARRTRCARRRHAHGDAARGHALPARGHPPRADQQVRADRALPHAPPRGDLGK